jgi:hypothetical protein
MIGLISATFTGCKNEGCSDPQADNYDQDAEKDDGSCKYPTINVTPAGNTGDIRGAGGSASKTWSFTNTNTSAGYDMSITATSRSFQLVLKDASGATVLDQTLTAGTGPQSVGGTTSSGTAGSWTGIITLTKFNGSGDYSFL